MKKTLTSTAKALANGCETGKDARPIMAGVLITDAEAVVADGFMLVIKKLQTNAMELDKTPDDDIHEVIIPGEALKACDGEEIQMQTIESMVKRE